MIRRAAGAFAFLFFAGTLARAANVGPGEVEEAAGVARRAAVDLLRRPPGRLFSETLDLDGILLHRLGVQASSRLTERQRERLRGAVAEMFSRALAPPRNASGEIAWSAARPAGGGVDVFFGLRYGEQSLKTRWAMRRAGAGWRVADIVLVDPGVSLAKTAEAALELRSVQRGGRGGEAWSSAMPRAGAIVVLALVVLAVGARISRRRRPLLYWTAAAPAALLAIDGALAVHRALSEPYVVRAEPSSELWRRWEQLALSAQREGRAEQAREHWASAISAGGPAGPIAYEIGLEARRRGDAERARAEFLRALSGPDPAPGAAKELASMEVADGRFAEAGTLLARYVQLAGPDPDTLALLAVVQTNLGQRVDALRTVREAGALLGGEGWREGELEAQLSARAGDAAGCVAALRRLEEKGRIDRSRLRSDPAYLPIATDPVWVAYLNEKPKT
ncbi:MAG TPA: hypothetical protein VOA00_08880 [Thermoanaerobaculia bacterium]|nr:hypothetical protein [Thermoanaerobaculia bacterium]